MHSISDYLMSASYEDVLMENLEACMHQEIATSPTAIGAPCKSDLPTVEGVKLPAQIVTADTFWRSWNGDGDTTVYLI